MTEEKELTETCPKCGKPTLEEKLPFKDKLYAVSICTSCGYFDWTLPEGIEDSNTPEFQESEAWAEEKANELRQKYGIVTIPIQFVSTVTEKDTAEFRLQLNAIAKLFGYTFVSVSQWNGNGIKIIMR